MDPLRKPFQGLLNILRFNWHYYAATALVLPGLALAGTGGGAHGLTTGAAALMALFALPVFVSLFVSWYVYDKSGLYTLAWMDALLETSPEAIVNIHAGFDETSALLRSKYSLATIQVLDFYDESRHTEISIRRARRVMPPYPGTINVAADGLPIAQHEADLITAILSLHEVRNHRERTKLLAELRRVLKPGGRLLVTEHLRDIRNFFAYTVGCFHFHSRASWLQNFDEAGLALEKEVRITPFITTFSLKHNDPAP